MDVQTILLTAVNAIFPIILMISLGYFLRQNGMLSDVFLKNANKLVFNISLPAMLMLNVYSIESLAYVRWDIVIYSSLILIVIFFLGLASAMAATPVPQRRGVVLQCVFRSNFAIIGLPLAASLGGAEAEASAAVLSAVMIPQFNVLAVVALSMFVSQDGKISARKIAMGIVKNPLIQGVAMGLFLLIIRALQIELFGNVVISLKRDLKFVYTVLNHLKSLTTPLALLVLGGQFAFSAVKDLRKEIIVSVCWRLLITPAIGIGGAYLASSFGLIQCASAEYAALVALFASPVAVSSAVMVSEMKNDEQLGTQLVVWTSLCSALTIFVIVCLLMALGLIVA